MAQPGAERLAHLARLIGDLAARREGLGRLVERLLPLIEADDVELTDVSVEAEYIEAVQGLLDEAEAIVAELRRGVETTRGAYSQLRKLEELLQSPEWDLLDTFGQSLDDKARWIAEDFGLLESFAGPVRRAEALLVVANEVNAPILYEAADLRQLNAQLDAAQRALRDRTYRDLPDLRAQLEVQHGRLAGLVGRIADKVEAARPFHRKAELHVLRLVPAAGGGDIPYTVLLRPPTEAGAKGMMVQGESHVDLTDRGDIWTRFQEDATSGINRSLARFGGRPDDGAAADAGGEDGDRPDTDLLLAGKLMYRLVVPDEMKSYFENNACSLTLVTNDLELPWELMHTDVDFLCLERPVSRMPMGHAFPREPAAPAPVERLLRFLLVYSDPRDNLGHAKNEIELLRQRFGSPELADRIERVDVLDQKADITSTALNEHLLGGEYDVIHFAGHADFDDDEPRSSGLVLGDGSFYPVDKIRKLLVGQPLVFLNACESGRTANEGEVQRTDFRQRPAEGLASAFIYGGARGCIGALWPVYDEPAAELAVSFYNRVVEGYTLGEAMRLTRREIRDRFPNDVTWASFILFGDPTGRLVTEARKTRATTEAPE